MAVVLGTNAGFVETAPTSDPEGAYGNLNYRSTVVDDTSPAGATRITEIGFWADSTGSDVNFEVGLYSADGETVPGEAGTRLYVDTTNALGTTSEWKTVSVDWEISASTKYWIAIQADYSADANSTNTGAITGHNSDAKSSSNSLTDPFGGGAYASTNSMYAIYALVEVAATGTNMKINIGDTFKDVDSMKINIADTWKAVESVKINVGDSWKTVF